METLQNLALGLQVALSVNTLMYCFFGVLVGTVIGVLPGIGSIAAISMLLPITYYLDPASALIMLAGVYYGAEYGGSTASILLNLPGTTSAVVTCLDGYPMAQKGRAGPALFMTTIASFLGGTVGVVVLVAVSPLMAELALTLRPPDYFAVMVLGLVAAATIGRGSPLKGIAMVVLGVLLGCVGMDANTGTYRFTLGRYELIDGINLIVLAMGLFGVAELIASARLVGAGRIRHRITLRSLMPTREDWRRSAGPMGRGTAVGSILGAVPGAGLTIASFLAYALEKRISRTPQIFGKGAIEGVTAPESANNAAAQTAFIPTLTLGIPGSPTMALMLGALIIHGIQPGPSLMGQHPEVFWGLIVSFWIGNILLVLLNIPLIGVWVRLLQIPYTILFPVIVGIICIGVYSINYNPFDVFSVLVFGVIGYGLRLIGFDAAPLLMGFVLGPIMEVYLRRGLLLSGGDFVSFMTRPISGTLFVVTAVVIVWAMWNHVRQSRRAAFGVNDSAA